MAFSDTLPLPGRVDSGDARRLIASIGLALAAAYAVFLAGALLQGFWIVD
jgi:hypothetical protein